jgi:hypothetical protein
VRCYPLRLLKHRAPLERRFWISNGSINIRLLRSRACDFMRALPHIGQQTMLCGITALLAAGPMASSAQA